MTNTESPDDSSCDSETASSEAHPILSRRDWLTTLSASVLGVTVSAATVSQSARAADPSEQLWTFETEGKVWSSPTVADGTVYVGSVDNNLYAVDAVTGKEQWTFETGDWVGSSPTVADGIVYVGSVDGNLYAVDAATGKEQWAFETGVDVDSSPTVADGTVYVGSWDGNLYAVDAVTGKEQWAFKTGVDVDSSPTVADGTVYVGSDDDNLYAVDAVTGKEQWAFKTGGEVDSSPTVADGTVYVGSEDSNLYAVDAATGKEQWVFKTGDQVWSSPTVADGAVYVGSVDNNLYAVDAATGDQQWDFKTGDQVWSSPTVADGVVYVGSDDDNLYAVDAATGKEQWAFETGDDVSSSPTVAGGTVYVGSEDSNLYVVETDHTKSSRGSRVHSQTDHDDTAPTVTAAFSVGTPTVNRPVQFDASSSSGSISSYEWDFTSDGTIDTTGQQVSHTFSQPETYTVTLTLTAETGGTVTTSREITVDAAPSANIGLSSDSPTVGQAVTLAATNATTGEDRTLAGYEWNFTNDGTVDATGRQVNHTFTDSGTYTVTLTVTDSEGATATTTREISVVAAPSAVVEVTPTDPVAGEPITFDATNSTVGGTRALSGSEWAFGDDDMFTQRDLRVTHTFEEPGTYTVRFRLTDSAGVSDTTSVTVTVDQRLSPTSTASPTLTPTASPTPTETPTPETASALGTWMSWHELFLGGVGVTAVCVFGGVAYWRRSTDDELWQFDTSGEVASSPAVVDGTVYVGSGDESLYAVDAATGTKQWQFDTSGEVASSPAVVDGTVYVGSHDHSLYAVDAATGSQQWRFDTSGEVASSPAVVDGTVYVGSWDNSLYAVDTATGTKQWQFDTSGEVSSPAVADGTVYVGSRDESLYAVDAATGDQQWAFETDGEVFSSPTVADATVYVGSNDSNLYAVDAATGKEQWTFETGDWVFSSPAVVNGTVYIGSDDESLYAVDTATGTKQWQFDTSERVMSSPAVADGTVYVGSHDGSLYTIETTGGSGEHPADTHRGLGQPVGEDNSNSPGSHLSSARESADEATGAREAGDYDRSIEAWQAALNEYERALDAAESKNDTETVSEIESVVQRVKTNLENTRTERRHTEVAELATEARDHVDTGNDAFEDEQFETAREEYEAALSAYQDALEIASGHEFDEADRLNEAITALERDIENCQLRQLAADLESAEATLADGEYDRAAETFEKLHPRINSLNIDRPDDVGRLRKRAQRGEVRAQLGQARDRLDAGQKAFDDGEYYDARETFQETQDVLNDVLELATDYGFDDLQRNANDMIEVASTNANEARKAVYDIGDVNPALDDVPDVRSGKTEYTPPTERRAEKSRGEGTDPNEPPNDPTPTPQGTSRGLHQSPPSHEQIEVLGRGGNATVWKVRRTETGELAALKRPHFRGSMEQEDARRFLREAETWAKVGNHPNVVAVREWGFDGQPWLLMNYCSGGDVSEMVGSVEVESALDILIDVAEALTHARGIDHLDIKPANVLIDSDGTAKLADWGLARVAFQHDQTDTSMGMSPPYAAPEQVERTLGPLDSRTDIYQLGVTAYELLTGERPFDPEAPESLERRILHSERPLPSDVDANIPTEVDVAVSKAMARDRSERYERAIEFRNDLRDIQDRGMH